MQRRRLLRVTSVLALLALGGCAGLLGPPTVTLSEAEIGRLMERNFPIDRTLLDIFDVSVDAPRVRLQPEANRLAAIVGVRARNRLFALGWQGQIDFDAALRWEPADQTVRLSQVRVRDLALVDPGAFNRNTVERLGAALAERVLEDSAIYRLPAQRAAQLREKGYKPASVNVTWQGLEIRFVPVPVSEAGAAPR